MSIRTYNTLVRSMARVCLGANILFPGWEQNIPTLGTKYSQPGNKTGLRLALDEITSRPRRDYVSLASRLRLVVLMLLMMVMGANGVKADDYSGIYYIANNNSDNYKGYNNADNFYLCPSTEYFNTSGINVDNGKPFLTTKKTGHAANALWIVEKVTDTEYYTFKQKDGDSYRYLTVNDQFSSGSTTYNANRRRVHLEPLSSTELTNRNYFTITYIHSKLGINGYSIGCVDDYKDGNNQYLNPAKGNFDQYNHYTSESSAGIIGFYTIGTSNTDAKGSVWFFEIPKPEISYSANNKITITPDANVTTFYTIDGSSPIDSSTKIECSGTQEKTMTDVTIVKTVASFDGVYSQVSTSVWLPISSDNQYLIQNLECTDFYMIPGDVSNNNTYVNTTSLFRPTMSWYFSDAGSVGGVQYYYIINGHTGDYLYFTSNNVYMKTSSDFDESDSYKFAIVQGFDADSNPDGFHIVPKSQISASNYCIYKGGWSDETTIANSKADAVKGSTNARRPEQKHTRWNFVQPNTLNKTAPFTVSDASTHITKFYKIASVGSSGYYIVPPTGNNTNATTSNSADAAVVKSGTWYFEVAQEPILTHEDPTKIDWCTYYYIRNAETGKYLYFIRDANNAGACLEMRSTIESGQEDRYMFTWAKTAATVANYYIVPKKLKDASQNNISSLRKNDNNTNIVTNITRGAGNFAWTFEDADLFCSNPVFEESGDNIVISCILGSAEIHYTTNGDDPSADGATYSVYPPATPLSASDKHLIKACAVVSDGATPTPNTASSEVITFIKNPDVTFTEGNEIPYAGGAAVKPTVSSVTITPEGGSTITIDATEYSVAYSNNTDVGEATVTISDALPENNIIISGTSHFTITPKSLGNGFTAADGITITLTKIGENEYSVTVKNGTITLTQYDANNSTASYDYTVSGTPDESGFVATVEAKKEGDVYTGNYTGKAKAVYVKANFPTFTSDTDGGSAAAYQATTNLAAPPDLKAYIVTGVDYNAGSVEVEELTYIPEDVPVLLLTEGDAPHNADFTATVYTVESGSEADVTSNKLRRSGGDVSADWGQYYIFSKGEFVLSMGDKTIKEGKYYFENEKYVSGSSPAPAPSRLYISRRGATRINEIVNNIYLTDSWYTLNGQKLNRKPTRKGIYMQNGKKVVIK